MKDRPTIPDSANQPDKQIIIERLIAMQGELRKMGVKYLALAGSVARGEARPDSDIVVDLGRPACSSTLRCRTTWPRSLNGKLMSFPVTACGPNCGSASSRGGCVSFDENREWALFVEQLPE